MFTMVSHPHSVIRRRLNVYVCEDKRDKRAEYDYSPYQIMTFSCLLLKTGIKVYPLIPLLLPFKNFPLLFP